MAADQRRKRLNGASIVGYNLRKQHRAKRSNLGSAQNGLNMKSHISVVWDDNKRRVIAKREQVGVSWRDVKPFINSCPHDHSFLADVFSFPEEIFELDCLRDVLSYEVWKTYLSEKERNILLQFLPRSLDPDQVLKQLLNGETFHFGNPFLKWGASLCTGSAHPDAIIKREQRLKSKKSVYYAELHKYHNDMVEYLIKLKERWESSEDQEDEIAQKLWRRSRSDGNKRISSNVNDSRLYSTEKNVKATSESDSWGADDKVSSDNQISSVRKGENPHRRMLENSSEKDKSKNPLIASDDMINVGVRPKNCDKLQSHNDHSNDSLKYMSYFKISKKQHELAKGIKQSGKSIQSRSLKHDLGNQDGFEMQLYEVILKQEQKKLHEHWLQLVNKDLPAAYANWRDRQIIQHKMVTSLSSEMADKLKPLMQDEDILDLRCDPLDQEDGGRISNESEPLDENDYGGTSDQSKPQDEKDDTRTNNQFQTQDEKDDGSSSNQSSMEVEDGSVLGSLLNQSPRDTSVEGQGLNPIGLSSERNHVMSTSDDAVQDKTEFTGSFNSPNDAIAQEVPLTSGGDDWQAVGVTPSFFESNLDHNYESASGLSLPDSQTNEEQPTDLIDLESDLSQVETSEQLLHRQPKDGSCRSYPNQEQNNLQSLFKAQGILPYHQDKKGDGLDFQTPNNVIMEGSPYPGHFKEPRQSSLALEQGHKRDNGAYMGENALANIFPHGGSYVIPRRDHLPQVNMGDWTARTVHLSAPPNSHLNDGNFLGHQWLPADHHFHSGWTRSNGGNLPSQNIGSVVNPDQSLYSVLSQHNQLQSGSPHVAVRPPENFLASRIIGVLNTEGAPRMNPAVSGASHQLDYLNGHEAANPVVPDDMAWMTLPRQNPALRDEMGKPYLRSWNS